jgi:dUTP pyrophosphatase
MTELKIYKLHPSVIIPNFATDESACFDLAFCPFGKEEYKGYNAYNKEFTRSLSTGSITIMPGDRILVPTGIIFDIPEGYSLRIHARSGLSLKNGLILANSEAVIDADYTLETMVMLTNVSDNSQVINAGDRIAQAELVVRPSYSITETWVRPMQRSNRVGGLGSTGVSIDNGIMKIDTSNLNIVAQTNEQPVKRGPGRPKRVVT